MAQSALRALMQGGPAPAGMASAQTAIQNAAQRPQPKPMGQQVADVLGGVALPLSTVPVVGDIAGLGADAAMYANYPEERTALNYGMTLAGMLPFVPGAAGVRAAEGALDMSQAARMQRAADFGGDRNWYRGSLVDEGDELKTEFLGKNTNSPSAFRGFFFASNPETASAPIYTTAPDDLLNSYIAAQYGDINNMLNSTRVEITPEIKNQFDTFSSQDYILKNDFEDQFYDTINQLVNNYQGESVGGNVLSDGLQFMYAPDKKQKLFDTMQAFAKPVRGADGLGISSELQSIFERTMPGLYQSVNAQKDIDLVRQHMDFGRKYLPQWARGGEDVPEELVFTGREIAPNVGKYKLNMTNPYIKDMGGEPFRSQSYDEIIQDAMKGGHDSVIIKNTYDGGNEMTDVGVIFEPRQARSFSADFDPAKRGSANLSAGIMGGAVGLSALRQAMPQQEQE